MGLMIKNNVKNTIKPSEFLVSMPKSAQQTIEILRVSGNGIFENRPGVFSKSYKFNDINYAVYNDEEKMDVLGTYMRFLTSLNTRAKITIYNKKIKKDQQSQYLYKYKEDGFDEIREFCNNHITQKKQEGRDGISQSKYITITSERESYDEAKAHFNTVEAGLKRDFLSLGTELRTMSSDERLKLLYDFYNPNEEVCYLNKVNEYIENKRDFKNDIIPSKGLVFSDECIKVGDVYKKACFIQSYPRTLDDMFFQEIVNYAADTIISIDIVPIAKQDALDLLEEKYMNCEDKIAKQQKVRNRARDYSNEISYTIRKEKADIQETMDDLNQNDQSFYYAGITIVISANNKEELKATFNSLKNICESYKCKLENCWGAKEQRAAMNTALPLGVMQVDYLRSMVTRDIAALVPFHVQEIKERNEFSFLGINQISKEPVCVNQKALVNGNGWIFGVSGSGKSHITKFYLTSVFLNTDDDIIIVDPKNEYNVLTEMFNGTHVVFSSDSDNRINPWEVDLDKLRNANTQAIINEKYELMMAIAENSYRGTLEQEEDSILSRVIKNVYERLANSDSDKQITWTEIYNELKAQPEEEASNLALSFELFVTGALNMFNSNSNVDLNNRLVNFGVRDMGERLSSIALVIMLENISQRIMKNYEQGRATRLVIDEFHELLKRPYTAKYMEELFKKVRSFGGLLLGITQNIADLLQMYSFTTMLSNSEFAIILKQSKTDAPEMCKNINGFTPAMIKYVFNNASGTGLIRYGDVILPFDNTMDANNPLFEIFDTNMFHRKR